MKRRKKLIRGQAYPLALLCTVLHPPFPHHPRIAPKLDAGCGGACHNMLSCKTVRLYQYSVCLAKSFTCGNMQHIDAQAPRCPWTTIVQSGTMCTSHATRPVESAKSLVSNATGRFPGLSSRTSRVFQEEAWPGSCLGGPPAVTNRAWKNLKAMQCQDSGFHVCRTTPVTWSI